MEECHCPTHRKSSHPTGQSSPQSSPEAITALEGSWRSVTVLPIRRAAIASGQSRPQSSPEAVTALEGSWRSVTVLPIRRAAIASGQSRPQSSPEAVTALENPERLGGMSLSYPSEEQPSHRAEQPAVLIRSRHCPRGAREAWRSVTVLPIGRAAIPPGTAARSPHQKPSLP
ncbi:hypothetical protein NDU88_011204 [Pleurodeles waltl]|uniref:Uncharacterized protein n=1 Tax=Pleurodeles waltl TaxID=8319 RepID=A0AAV7Q2F8_PLEWA|nr:hypothetical protein NDU88_011204 [Pleurodeles waltl]